MAENKSYKVTAPFIMRGNHFKVGEVFDETCILPADWQYIDKLHGGRASFVQEFAVKKFVPAPAPAPAPAPTSEKKEETKK